MVSKNTKGEDLITFRKHNSKTVLVGVCLWVVRREFGDKIPTLSEYAAHAGVSTDTIRRAVRRLTPPVLGFLRSIRPGPQPQAGQGSSALHAALEAANSVLLAVLPQPLSFLLSSCPHRRGVVVQLALHWRQQGVSFATMASFLGLSTRTLRRWNRRFRDDDGTVPHTSRRPRTSPNAMPAPIQETLWLLGQAFPKFPIAEITRIFNRAFAWLLKEHGHERVSEKTVAKYLRQSRSRKQRKRRKRRRCSSSQRGDYRYPKPLSMAWVDTTYFKIAGCTIHIVGAMEASSRIALAANAFVQESTQTTLEILELALARVPELEVTVRDRGTPYLNDEVTGFLADRGILPFNAHPYFPIDKAALERWWRTLKEWLRHALGPFEERCDREGRVPAADELVRIVRPALRVFLRAYNLIPQAYLDGKSPIARIDALLRGEGESGLSLSDLRRMAMDRDDKNELLAEIKDVLQATVTIKQMRCDFIGVSNAAIRAAIKACSEKLAHSSDPPIRAPYRYLRAVARNKECEIRQERARVRSLEAENQRFDRAAKQASDVLRSESEDRTSHPEKWLPSDLRRWIETVNHPIQVCRHHAVRRLRETIKHLQLKLGTAADALIASARQNIPALAEECGHSSPDTLATQLDGLTTLPEVIPSKPPATRQESPQKRTPVSPARSNLGDLVRSFLDHFPRPHVSEAHVPP